MRGISTMDVVLVVAVVALGVLTWLPWQRVRGVLAAEDVAMANMHLLDRALQEPRAAARRDLDGDGRGETPPIAAIAAGIDGFEPSADGNAWRRDGYWFTVLVPDHERLPAAPRDDPALADPAEATYVLIGWPCEPGRSGMRAYLRSPLDGLLRHAVDGYPYGGPDRPPAPRVALVESRSGTLRAVRLKSGLWVPPRETLREKR